MIRYYLLSALLFIMIVHYLTPSWMLTDFNQLGDWVTVFFLLINMISLFKIGQALDNKLLLICIITSVVFIVFETVQGEEVTSSSIRLLEVINIDYTPTPFIANTTGLISLACFFIFLAIEVILNVKVIRQLTR